MSKKETYDDIGMLINDLKSDIKDVLMDEILDKVKDIELKHIEQEVFSTYTPKIYERRGHGGLDDPDNIVGTLHDMELEVENITEFNPGYGTSNHGQGLPQLVNEGSSRNGYFYDYPGEFEKARPFLDNTAEEVEQTNSVEDALAKGLAKRNYDVT